MQVTGMFESVKNEKNEPSTAGFEPRAGKAQAFFIGLLDHWYTNRPCLQPKPSFLMDRAQTTTEPEPKFF